MSLLLALAVSLQPAPEAIRAIFAEWDRDDSPGCAVGALRNGEFAFRDAFGMANLDDGVSLTPESVFRMASVSKQFTVAAVLLAERDGLLTLDNPIRHHFPELPAWADPVTVRHLIHHTSGIRDYLTVMWLRGQGDDAHYSDADVAGALGRLERLNFEPGSEYLYSNSGYWLLGQLLPRVSGSSLRQFAGERLLEPLGMTGSHFHDDVREVVPGRARGYRPRDGGGWELDETTLGMVGDGGLYTSVSEMAHWERMFLDPAAFGPEFLESLLRRGELSDGRLQTYAGGLVHGTHGGRAVIQHGGGFVGFRTFLLRFPEDAFAVHVLCNAASADPGALARAVADRFLPPLEEADPPEVFEIEGAWWDGTTGSFVTDAADFEGRVLLDEPDRVVVRRRASGTSATVGWRASSPTRRRSPHSSDRGPATSSA